jgi:AmmeMemoRadiSam system protein B
MSDSKENGARLPARRPAPPVPFSAIGRFSRRASSLGIALLLFALLPRTLHAQATPQPAGQARPGLEEVRKAMAIPSSGDLRGQQDAVGYASQPGQMARLWELSALPPAPESFGARPIPGVLGAICPHDDYLYAGRVYRQVIPLVTARTVVLVGVFHRYRRFGAHGLLVFDPYRAWRSPDGEIKVSDLREPLLALLPAGDFVQDAAMQDSEHSLEAIAFWLRHQRPDVEILPLIVPSAPFERLQELAARMGRALASLMKARSLALGKDLAIVVSSDGVHYGADFKYTPFGEGGVEAYLKAVEQDRAILKETLAGPLSAGKARGFFAAVVDPKKPDEYRLPWCGRFSIPFGLLLLGETAGALGLPAPIGVPVAFGNSVGTPELPLRELGLGSTAPANLFHFVSYPGVALVAGK